MGLKSVGERKRGSSSEVVRLGALELDCEKRGSEGEALEAGEARVEGKEEALGLSVGSGADGECGEANDPGTGDGVEEALVGQGEARAKAGQSLQVC